MTLRCHVDNLAPGLLRLPDAEARHTRLARRLSVGDPLMLFDGRGHEATARIASIKPAVDVQVDDVQFRPRPTPALTLATAMPKGPRQDVLVEKCTELGAACLWPLIARRSVAEVSPHKRDKWRRTSIEAAKQSGQCWLPDLPPPCKVDELIEMLRHGAARYDLILLATAPEQIHAPPPRDGTEALVHNHVVATLSDHAAALQSASTILALIGPEGGWTEEEIAGLIAVGAQRASLGPNVLRIETAAIALAAWVHAVMAHGRGARQ